MTGCTGMLLLLLAGPCGLASSSVSASMLSRRDSTPATAWERNDPHFDDFAGAAMVGSRWLSACALVVSLERARLRIAALCSPVVLVIDEGIIAWDFFESRLP